MGKTVVSPRRVAGGAWTEVGVRACNAAEQILLGERLRNGCADVSRQALGSLDEFKLRRAASGLASGWPGDPLLTAPRREHELLEALAAHRRRLRSSDVHRSGSASAALAELHADWLATYVAALDGLCPVLASTFAPGSRSPRRELLAQAARPFCQLLARELTAATRTAEAASGRELIGAHVIPAIAEHLIDRFELSLAWAVETDENVAFARARIARTSATSRDHEAYFARAFGDATGYDAFYLRFPVLARWLARVTRLLCDAGCELIRRLSQDAQEIGETLFGESIVGFTRVELGGSDYHAGGRSVAILDVELESRQASFVYKPRCLAAERATQELLGRLTDDGIIGFAQRHILCKDGYGYEQLVPSGATEVRTLAQARRFYAELGGLLAVFYVLGGSDLHHENVIVADGHAYVCDCETVLGVSVHGREAAIGTVLDSVYRTGLLDWPMPASADIVTKLSGVTGGESYELPYAVPRLQAGSQLVVRYERGVRVEQTAANRIRLHGELLEPHDFEQAIVEGFCEVHDWFRSTPRVDEYLTSLFAGTETRFVARGTQLYSQLLIGARHPICLSEPLEVDLVFARLDESLLPWDEDGRAAAAEVRALWQLDVPRFTAEATGRRLRDDEHQAVGLVLEHSPLEGALERISWLTEEDRERQVGYIRASLSLAEVHSPAFVATALDYARLIAEELCTLLDGGERAARWAYREHGHEARDIGGSLYYGSAGIALFLAYLDAIEPDARLRRAARLALSDALSHRAAGLGVFDGVTGLVYVLLHLHRLWGEPQLLSQAIECRQRVDALVEEDEAFDVLSGVAGVIAVMLAFDGAAGVGRDTAHRCARHLLRHAERVDDALSWPGRDQDAPSLTGFAHGAGGIGWALSLLGAASGETQYLDAARRAFAYERQHFDKRRGDWYDLRSSVARRDGGRHFSNAWCNGAPGIGLSRLGSWAATGGEDEELLREVYLALSATVRSFGAVGNDTLCHGRCGNAELLLRFALEQDEPAFQLEANMHAQAHWHRLAGNPSWPRVEDGRQPLTGLMVGIAGVGMHFLRLAAPDRVPSPLLLDPPQPER